MKKSLIALLIMTVLTSCFSCKSFKINVNLDNSTDKTVYLERLEEGGMKVIDSVIAKDNTAVFKVKQSKNTDAYHIMIDGWKRPLPFFADNHDVMIKGDYQKYNGISVEASESQAKLNEFIDQIDKMEDENNVFYCAADFVKQNIDNPLGVYALYRYKWAFNQYDLDAIFASVPKDLQSGYKYLVEDYLNGLKRTSQGQPFIDFTQKDINGETFTFSSVFGQSKAVILDFWASWCPDCRKANPELVAIYEEFKDKGLTIVSVSLDTDEAAWKKAVADDSLTWPYHVSDLKGWKNAVAEEYSIAFIPQTIIFDNNGIIIEKNLPFVKMEDMLLNMMK